MKVKLKKLEEQVLVITGASSGIGLATARRAARRGARLVLVSRNGDALEQLVTELQGLGAEAMYVVADVGEEDEVQAIADAAIERFGRIDTWVNNAGVSAYGRLDEVPLADKKRIFETNFWGVVHGSLAAVRQLKERGGALINVGSEVSEAAVPLQGIYSASKHAVKGFTDALRVELADEGAPVSVTLVRPTAIDTMFVPHAKNFMDVEPKLPAPKYAPELVADAILLAAEFPRRDVFVGGPSRLNTAIARTFPKLYDRLARGAVNAQRTDEPAQEKEDTLYSPGQGLQERQGAEGRVRESSAYTAIATHPKTALAGVAVLAAGALAAWQLFGKPSPPWYRAVLR